MPEGRYTAIMQVDGYTRTFGPTVVSAPQEVVSLDAQPTGYTGRVIHARTGRPVPGAFVLVPRGRGEGHFSDLTNEQWDRIEQLDEHGTADLEALEAIQTVYGFGQAVRTDADGRYELVADGGTTARSILCFARDFIPVEYRVSGLAPDSAGRVEVPAIPFYPAARVKICVRATGVRSGIAARWEFDPNEVPAWAVGLCGGGRDRRLSPRYAHGYGPDIDHLIHVPADVPLRLTVRPPRMSRLSPWTYPQTLCLPQGAVVDLGPCSLPEAVPVVVQVVDSGGAPVEGVPVHFMTKLRALEGQANSDVDGLVTLYAPPHSAGQIGVFPVALFDPRASEFEPETVPFEVGGAEEKNERLTLVLSDALRMFLFDRSK
jgi:hypothetical protein